MGVFDHWHPVLSAKALKRKPVAARLHGTDLVLFRGNEGQIGVLDDCCPHRRMRLSRGKVIAGRLQCPYHGWTFDCAGNGESPGTPKLHAQAHRFDATERLGVVWVKSVESSPVFPPFPTMEQDGYFHLCTLHHVAPAPLEVTLDNFCEIEHTPTTHSFFGYELKGMPQVEVRFEPTDTTVRVINHGPPKKIFWLLRWLLGIRRDYLFYDDWTTHFSPVYSIYDHWWMHPETKRECMVRWKLFIFFTPRDDGATALTTFAFTKSRWPGPAGAMRLFRWLVRRKLDYEINLDVNILEGLADQRVDVEGMKLSRFDKVLTLNRERIERVYRGREKS